MKLFKETKTGEIFFAPTDRKDFLMRFDGAIVVGNTSDLEEVDTKPVKQNFRRLHVVEESFSFGCDQDWHLKDVLYVPVDGKEVAFRVEHISDEKVYFVAIDAVGKSSMTNMNDYLDAYLAKMPESLVNNMCEMEHCVDGNIVRRSKLTLLSRKNVKDSEWNYECNGADDITFDGLKTEAERCKNFDGRTEWYWLDTPRNSPNVTNSTHFWLVNSCGCVYSSNAYSSYSVVPCFALKKEKYKS